MNKKFARNILYHETPCYVMRSAYTNARPAVVIMTEDDEPMAVASINIPEVNLVYPEVIIKNYSENEGIEDFLIMAGVIEPEVVKYISTGYVVVPVYKLTKEFLEI